MHALTLLSLSGSLPSSLSSLTGLLGLTLSNNKLSGTIPPGIGSLTSLKALTLSGNSLTGTVPPSMGSLTNLQTLFLYSNLLTGTLPPSLGSLAALTFLYAFSNQLSGSIPSTFGSLTSMTDLSLYENNLSGNLPASLANATSLTSLQLHFNALSGSIPPQYGAMTQLAALTLNNNLLSGTVPPQLGSLTSVTNFRIDTNQLTGSVPAFIGSLTSLVQYGVASNLFTGSLPAAMFDPGVFTSTISDTIFSFSRLAIVQPVHVSVSSPAVTVCLPGTFSIGVSVVQGQSTAFAATPLCQACQPGYVAAQVGSTYCTACAVRLYGAGDGITCLDCPANSVSLPGSSAIANCSCSFGFEQNGAANGAFTCDACKAGSFYNTSTSLCQTCAPGSYTSSSGALTCAPCPVGTFGFNSSVCSPCPSGSTSVAGTSTVFDCQCLAPSVPPYTAYQEISDDAASFSCHICPDGALCSGLGLPLALDGFWHQPGDSSEFFECEDGFCLADEAGANLTYTQCREGHQGIVCGECVDGWTIQGEFCAACPANSAFSEWPKARLGGIIFVSVFLFLCGTITFMLSPIIRPEVQWARLSSRLSARLLGVAAKADGGGKEHSSAPGAAAAKIAAHAASVAKILAFVKVPVRLVIENLQIISSFKRTLHLAWPSIFSMIIKRASFLNFSFCAFPGRR